LPAVTENNQQCVLLFTPKGEMHDLPLLFAQFLMKKKGVKTIMLGRNSTTEMLAYCCKHQPVTHLYFSLITNFTNHSATVYINKLSAQFPRLQIIAGGGALKDVNTTPANVLVLRSVQEVIGLQLPAVIIRPLT
jgi:methanogenic corrinoid protein MtbC1